MRIILTIVVIILVIIGSAVLLFETDIFSENSPTANGTSTNDVVIVDPTDQNNWLRYQGAVTNFSFAFSYPAAATTSDIDATTYEVKYIGPNNLPNTEISDGYYMTIAFREADSIDAYIEGEDPTSPVRPLNVNNTQALTYTTLSALGTTDTNVVYQLFSDEDWLIDVTYTVLGNQADLYQSTVMNIISTIEASINEAESETEETMLQIAMLDYDGVGQESDGPTRACDRLVFVEETIQATTTPLTAALHTLFAYEDTSVGGWDNFIAKTNDTLTFEEVTINNGVASVYLSGELSGLAGVCDNPRARIQIEETALQFSTVDEVEIYLNGQLTELQPSGQGV